MPPLPLTIRWAPALRRGRVLFVVCAYHGRDRDDTARGVLERREPPSARGHRIVHRDHYANPRPLPYVLGLLAAGADLLCDQPPDVVIDSRWESDPPPEIGAWCRTIVRLDVATEAAWRQVPLADLAGYDHVALAHHASVLVINGRRRAFVLDGALRRRLQVHRWLANTRIVERVLATVIQPVAVWLARCDRRPGATHD
jgi:hypothetical protein